MDMFRKILELVVIAVIAYAVIHFTTARVIVDGPSMEPTVYSGQLLLVSRVHYALGTPQRGDIVVFHSTNGTQELIKRVIGLPGETMEFRDGWVYINGRLEDEPYVYERCDVASCPNNIWQLGIGEYFVMGDNRNFSTDSRSFGTIALESIVGKVLLRYYPLSEFSWLNLER
jgi:signal peptidase I